MVSVYRRIKRVSLVPVVSELFRHYPRALVRPPHPPRQAFTFRDCRTSAGRRHGQVAFFEWATHRPERLSSRRPGNCRSSKILETNSSNVRPGAPTRPYEDHRERLAGRPEGATPRARFHQRGVRAKSLPARLRGSTICSGSGHLVLHQRLQGSRTKPIPTCSKWASPVRTCWSASSRMTTKLVRSVNEMRGLSR